MSVTPKSLKVLTPTGEASANTNGKPKPPESENPTADVELARLVALYKSEEELERYEEEQRRLEAEGTFDDYMDQDGEMYDEDGEDEVFEPQP